MNETIEQLKKITLELTLFPLAPHIGERREARLQMHYGVGSDGLSGLEMALAGRKAGERLRFDHVPHSLAEFFGPLLGSLRMALHGVLPKPDFALEVEILAVEAASPRDLVQAMARSLTHGCGGGNCDCGCGGA